MYSNPLVSVLMTSFNREKFISEAIESVLASTFTNFELIIVDDCSTDNTLNIAIKYEKKDPRIKVFKNDLNLGDYPNRNKAASYAIGKYIKYLDADDLIYPNGLEVMINSITKFPNAKFGTQFFEREMNEPYPILLNSFDSFQYHFFGKSPFQSGPTGTILLKDEFFKLGQFSGRRYIGDTEMWMKFALEGPIVLFQPALIWWRKHQNQEFRLGQGINGYIKMNHLLFFEIISNSKTPLNLKQKRKALYIYKSKSFRLFLSELIKKRKIKNALKIYSICNLSIIDFFKLFFKY